MLRAVVALIALVWALQSSLADAVTGALRTVELELAADEARKVELSEAERWARDPEGWIDAHAWIASKFAGKRGRVGPMKMTLFPDQRVTIAEWIDLELLLETGELVFRNVVIEKSRQIGETWLFAAVLAWALHYHVVQGLCIHQKGAEIADRGFTPKSLFGKIRYIDRRLDRRRVPGLGSLHFQPFQGGDPAKVTNEATGAVLFGESQRDDPGRGGTFDVVLVDEAAFVRHGEAVYAAIDEACPDGKALLSTVNGSDNFHARIADEEPEGWRYLRLHWSTHPVYSKGLHVAAVAPRDGRPGGMAGQATPAMLEAALACELCKGTIAGAKWVARGPRAHRFPGRLTSPHYDRAVIGKTIEQVASELDIDRERSLTGRVYDEFDSSIHVFRGPDGREAEIEYDPDLPLELGWDYGLDVSSVVIAQDHPLEYRIIGEVELYDRPGETPTPDNVARELLLELRALGVDPRFLEPEWTRRIYAIGDPAGHSRSQDTGRPLVSAYRAHGFTIGRPPRHLSRTVEPSITSLKRLLTGLPKPLRVSARCQKWIYHARHNRWPTDSQGQRRAGSTVPKDDVHNHMMRATAYLALAKFPPTRDRAGSQGPDPWDDSGDFGAKKWGSLLADRRPLPYDTSG